MATATRILDSTHDWTSSDHDALAALYRSHGGSAPCDLAGLLDWSQCTGVDLITIAIADVGGFDAAILLTRRRVAGVTTVRLAGHGWADLQVVPARTPDAAVHLAAAVADWLSGSHLWRIDLEQLPAHDHFAEALSALFAGIRTEPGDPLPYLDWPAARTPTNWGRKKFRQQSRQSHRQLIEERGETSVCTYDTAAEILPRLAGYNELFDAREQELGRPSAMRDAALAATKERVLRRAGERGQLQSWELRVGGELVAYYLAIRNGSTQRMWDGRMAPGVSQFSPGTILMAHALQEWHQDPTLLRVDFMRGANEFKRRLRSGEIETQRLRAWSTPWLATMETTVTAIDARLRRVVRTARDRSPAVAQLIRRLR